MKEPEKILEAKDICKAYGNNMVLNQVNLTIKAGDWLEKMVQEKVA